MGTFPMLELVATRNSNTPLAKSVNHVFTVASYEQVRWSYARRVVAFVTSKLVICQLSFQVPLERNAMGALYSTFILNGAIPITS